MQSKKMSGLESMVNTVVGVWIGFCILYFVSPMLGFSPSVEQSLGMNAIFIVTSTARSYVVRRTFNHIHQKKEKI